MSRKERDQHQARRVTTRRALLLGGAMTAVFATLGTRLQSLTVKEAEQFKLLAEENRVSFRIIAPARGRIQDRAGAIIADNTPNYRVTLTREDADHVEGVLEKLGQLIEISPQTLERVRKDIRRSPPFAPITVVERLSWDDLSIVALNAPALPGITPEVGLSRIYPQGANYSHVVGYVGSVSQKDIERESPPDPLLSVPKFQIGKIGAERWLEHELRGKSGTRQIEVNAFGRVMRELERREGDPGADIRLTIDSGLQNFAQRRLGDEAATAIVIDVRNGDLVAIASAPSFDPNLFVHGISHHDYDALLNDERRPLVDKSVQGLYPPGSTFKIVTALAALSEGVASSKSTVTCTGYVAVAGRDFHCWKRGGHGKVNLEKSLAQSCDVYFYDMAQKVGIEKITEVGRKLGLGMRHELPMSAIAEGLMPSKEWKRARRETEWRVGDTLNASIGQGYVLTSPLQLAVMTARLATGQAVVPRLIKSRNGREVEVSPPQPLGLESTALHKVRAALYQVMNTRKGTAYSSRIEEKSMKWAGKTGTSQVRNITAAERTGGVVSNDDLPRDLRDHALFVGFAPYDKPQYAVVVVVEHGGSGSAAAAPIARDIMLRALHGDVPPLSSYPKEQRPKIKALFDSLPIQKKRAAPAPVSRA